MAQVLSDQALQTLRWSRRLVEPAMREAVSRLPSAMSTVVGYQFGWCDEKGSPVQGEHGKGVRQTLVLLSAEAVGGRAESAVPAAVAVELVHNFSLVHDDIIDGDATRRHRPSAWACFGVPAATLAGDAMLSLAVDVMARALSASTASANRALTTALLALVHGQCADIEFETRDMVGQDEYFAMAAGKTAALLSCACAMGAVFGGAEPDVAHQLHQFGYHLGLSFQLIDDLLGIWGDPTVTGKPARSDLRSRKKTFPVVTALESDSSAGRELAALYGRREPLDEADLDAAVELIEQTRGRERTQVEALAHLSTALQSLRAAHPVPGPATELTALAHLVTDRQC